MITLIEAIDLARKEINELEKISRLKLIITEEHTISFEFGWMFFYQSEEYVKTKNMLYIIGGNAPLIVDKYNGAVIGTGTGKEPLFYIEKYCLYRRDIKAFDNAIRS